jgi:hypothetical protein
MCLSSAQTGLRSSAFLSARMRETGARCGSSFCRRPIAHISFFRPDLSSSARGRFKKVALKTAAVAGVLELQFVYLHHLLP